MLNYDFCIAMSGIYLFSCFVYDCIVKIFLRIFTGQMCDILKYFRINLILSMYLGAAITTRMVNRVPERDKI